MIDEDGLKKKLEDLAERIRRLEHYCKELKYSQAGLEIRIDGMRKKTADCESYLHRNAFLSEPDPRRFAISDNIKSNKCAECAGRGEIYFKDEDDSSNFLKVKTCEICQGTGIIK
jgi:excinuclease UvrABC ATPase subunit